MSTIYFDNAATTCVRKEVFQEMAKYLTEDYGNPSSIYGIARESKSAIETARSQVADLIGAKKEEIYFTGSGTEADNWAIKGIAESYSAKGKHIITSAVEHHAVLHTCEYLGKNGFDITYLPVDENGLVRIEDLKNAIRPDTILISIMFANNEIGTIEPIEEIGLLAKENGILFHTDAVQAVGHIPINVAGMHIDLLSLSAHKMYGPKGVGALYVKKGVKIKALIHGGAQERNRRAGTENVAGIAGLGKAAELLSQEMAEEQERLTALRDQMIEKITNAVPYCRLNGHGKKRLPGNVNISFDFIEGESMLLMLDLVGICASSGSACTSGSLDPSHVLLAIGLPHEKAHGSLRLTLGKDNTMAEVDTLIEVLPEIVQKLRDMSPLYEEFIKKGN